MSTAPGSRHNLADLVSHAAARFGDRPALIDDHRVHTWAELDAAADTGAADLLEAGSAVGDRVLIALPTSANLAVALIAVARAGLVAVPVDPDRASVAVADRVRPRIGLGTSFGLPIEPASGDIDAWWTRHRAPVPAIGGGESIAQLARASRGPHAVMVSHRAVLAAVGAVVSTPRLELRADDRALLALPLFHLAGLVTAFLPLATVGAAAVLPMDSPAAPLAEAIRRHKVTVLPGSPPLYRQLLRSPQAERSLASVRLMTSGAAPLLPEDFSAMRSLTGQGVWEGYGISEATSVVATSLMTERARPGSVGLPVPGLQLRIVPDDEDPSDTADSAADDAAGQDTGAGTDQEPPAGVDREPAAGADAGPEPADIGSSGDVGRIALRGPMLFSGYWPDASGGPDADGWYLTTDVAYTDDHGELHLVDRAVDTFTVSGFTVYPREIERILAEHPQVAECAVVGIRGDRGTGVVAVVVPRRGTRPATGDLAGFTAERLPEFKRPTEFELVEDLPRTELGRIDRAVVLQEYLARAGIDASDASVSTRPGRALAAAGRTGEPDDVGTGAGPATSDVDTDARHDADSGGDADVAPEPAAGLDELGRRLPRDASRGRRSAEDSDEDLFGEDYQ